MIVGIVCPQCGAYISESFERETEDHKKLESVVSRLDKSKYSPLLPAFICRKCDLILEPPDGIRTSITVTEGLSRYEEIQRTKEVHS